MIDIAQKQSIWHGGFYELSMEFDNVTDLQKALQVIKQHEQISGFWPCREQLELPPCPNFTSDMMYGKITMAQNKNKSFPFVLSMIEHDGNSHWLDFAIPQGAFQKYFPYQYPLTIEKNRWLSDIRFLYVNLAVAIHEQVAMEIAMIGEEVSGFTSAHQLTSEQVKEYTMILPNTLQEKLNLSYDGVCSTKDLVIHYAT